MFFDLVHGFWYISFHDFFQWSSQFRPRCHDFDPWSETLVVLLWQVVSPFYVFAEVAICCCILFVLACHIFFRFVVHVCDSQSSVGGATETRSSEVRARIHMYDHCRLHICCISMWNGGHNVLHSLGWHTKYGMNLHRETSAVIYIWKGGYPVKIKK